MRRFFERKRRRQGKVRSSKPPKGEEDRMCQNPSPSAANTRRYVVVQEDEGVGAYDFRWSTSLSVRRDGLRFRYYHRGFRWVGNEGGVHEEDRYLTPAEAREMWDREFAEKHEKSFEELVAAALAR